MLVYDDVYDLISDDEFDVMLGDEEEGIEGKVSFIGIISIFMLVEDVDWSVLVFLYVFLEKIGMM